jgi:hypothetical protein
MDHSPGEARFDTRRGIVRHPVSVSDRCCLPLYEEILIETRATPE